MIRCILLGLFTAVLLAATSPAGAQPAPTTADAARQAAGLFLHVCVRFSGDPAGLRAFMAERKVPTMHPQAATTFLGGRPGQAFDTTNASGRMAAVSHDDGSCSAFSESADGEQAVAEVEQGLKTSGIEYRLIGDSRNPKRPSLRQRRYEAWAGARKWAMVLSSGSEPGRLSVMFTAWPRP